MGARQVSLSGLFDHRAEIWALEEKRGFAAQNVQTPVPVLIPTTGFNCAVVPPLRVAEQNIGPGETPRGRTTLYLGRAIPVEERNLVRLMAGSEAPSAWRVVSKAAPRGHHIELVVEPWAGTFPEVVT